MAMREHFSFKTMLIISFWVVLVAASLLPSWYYYRNMTATVISEAENSTLRQLNLVHWMLVHGESFGDIEHLQDWLVSLAKQMDLRITYVAKGGRVIADTQFTLAEIADMDNFSSRPEIVQAENQELGKIIRSGRTIPKEHIYVAKRIDRRGGIPAGVLRLAAPFSAVKEQLDHLRNSFFFIVSLIFVATLFLSYGLTRRLKNPILSLVDAAQAIGRREYKRRLRFNPGQEFYPLAQSINEMAESIDKHLLDIKKQKQELEAVFNGMQEGVMVLDSKGRIQSINKALSELISHSHHILGRRPLEVIMSLELQEACDRVVSSQMDVPAAPHNLQISLGEERTYDVNIVRFQDQQSGMGAIVAFHDISELKRLEKVRQDFVANVSHELRTPLTSIKGYAEILLSGKKPPLETFESFLQLILKNTNHMVKMVEDLLQLARLEGRPVPLKILSVNAAHALLVAWKRCAQSANAKKVELNNQLPNDGVLVSAEFDQLVQVFRILLENAIQHSPAGKSVTIACSVRDKKTVFSVRNEGPGIPKQHHKRIFERFYRIERHRGIDSGSTGLGLAICRHIVLNHGGSIWLQSPNPNETEGATFFFTLLAAPEGQQSPQQ